MLTVERPIARRRRGPQSLPRRPHLIAPHDASVRLSLLMPAYNEERTISRAVASVLGASYPCEIELVVVDDGSTDRTAQLLAEFDDPRLVVRRHQTNRGKGAALLTAARVATGTHVVIFDADLEYSPEDIPALLEPVLKGRRDVVYGVRIFGMNTVYQSYTQALGNRATTFAANVLYDASLTDMHTCLKLLPLDLFHQLGLTEQGFGLDTEITAALLRLGIRPFEVPVSYYSRTRAEGKKLTWRAGIECLLILGRKRFVRRAPGYVRPAHPGRPAAPATARPILQSVAQPATLGPHPLAIGARQPALAATTLVRDEARGAALGR